ncbi:acyl-[ACP]--phospholipid O-acyltransferase [Helicobacter saguini]|nr:acyl-[ACP]--phospholipid O-acyltransferase [Helicobacter saguini]
MNKIYKILGFTPFMIVTFINAFIDLGHKVIMLGIVHKCFSESSQLFFNSIINALIILPFILVFSPSGFLSDKYPKNQILKVGAGINILLFALLLLCYFNASFWLAFAITFLLGLQAAFYSPAKYGYIKELVGRENLTWGNGAIQATAIVAMLLSMVIFSSLFEQFYTPPSESKMIESRLDSKDSNVSNALQNLDSNQTPTHHPIEENSPTAQDSNIESNSPTTQMPTHHPIDETSPAHHPINDSAGEILNSVSFLAVILLIFAILEFVLSFRLPTLKPIQKITFDRQKYLKLQLLKENLKLIKSRKMIFLPVIFVAIFWSISQLLVDIFPVYVKHTLGILDTRFVNIALGCTGLGVICGSIIAGRYSKNYIETGLIPLGACFMFFSLLFITSFESLFMLSTLFFLFGLGGGFYIVPLNALMQFYSNDKDLGKILAGNNFIQNIGMLLSLIVASICALWLHEVEWLFYLVIFLGFIAMIYMLKLMPFSLVRFLVSLAILQRYRLIVEGFNNIPQKKCGVLLLGNHISFIDWAIVQMALPKKVYFVMERSIYSRWYIRVFLDFFGVIPVSNIASKGAIEQIQKRLNDGEMVCLFPEGVISRHGHLNEFKSGFEKIAMGVDKDKAVILPFYICGMWGSVFSRSNEQFRERKRSFTKRSVSIAFGEPLDIHTQKDKLKAKVFEMSFKAWEHQCQNSPTLAGGFIESCKRGGGDIAIVDTQSGSMSYRRLLTLCIMLSQDMKEMSFKPLPPKKDFCSLPNDCVGIFLPSSTASVICNIATTMAGKIMVNLNFTAGVKAVRAAIDSVNISHIYTSRKFLEKMKDRGLEFDFGDAVIHYMEDIVADIKKAKFAFLANLVFMSVMPTWLLKLLFAKDSNIDSVCAILFSSGSEGNPKGVMLTNLNIMSNIAQIADVIHARNDDCILASLPPFHAFGLTVTTLMPLIENMTMIAHADPTDAVGIAKAIALNKVTIMCATSTLLGIYTRNNKLDKVMFDSLRLTVAGAEKLKAEVREAYTMKFNKPIYEGYGATETTPVASVNLPDEFDAINWEIHRASKVGTVGMPLPGTAVRIVEPDSMETLPTGEQGLILIGGHQIMRGYLNDMERTNEVIVELEGIRWYKSGDKGFLDSDGFLHITDRYSRFVKIGGEMVGLSSLEDEIAKVLKLQEINTDSKICAVGLEDSKKGEKIVLLIESKDGKHEEIIEAVKSSNIIPLKKPSSYFVVESIPVLGSGKIDLKNAKTLAETMDRS